MTMQQIGRFEVLRELGAGGQGVVYLAHDPQLDRQVAIKTLHKTTQSTDLLTNEARIVSRLQHPNIIPLFDVGEHRGVPYLVYAYVEGKTLAALIKEKQKLSLVQAAEIACGILDGLVCAHAIGIVHLDVKPANVMLTAQNVPMVMDFGLARWTSDAGQVTDFTLSGTPRYIAPELIAGQAGTFLADVYSVGAVLYEMVTGKSAVYGEGIFEVLNRAANESVTAPSQANERIDERLETIILKAIAKRPEERYASALDMRRALQEYLSSSTQVLAMMASENSTLEFLVRRMRSKQDFPTISDSISEINKIVASDTSSTSRLTSVILQDFSLTSKLLKMVNAAVFSQYGGSVNTVSKAVAILGFEAVRSIAASLIFIDFLQDKTQAAMLKDEITQAILSSIVAGQLAASHDVRDTEEVMLCAMFHSLGKLLVLYYFFEEGQSIARLIEQGDNEEQASKKVLGISYHELGNGIARIWHFSARLLAGMGKLQTIKKTQNDLEMLTTTVNLANELCESARYSDTEHKQQVMDKLLKRYAAAVHTNQRKLSQALDVALKEFATRSGMLALKVGENPLLEKIRSWNGKLSEEDEAKPVEEQSEVGRLEHTLKSKDEEIKAYLRTAESELTLGAGIQDVTNSLIGDFVLNDVLQMILETIYRGLKFNRALLLVREPRLNMMVARYGLGDQVDSILPMFRFPLGYQPDVFHLALCKGVDIAIENTQAANIVDKIPDWYKKSINAPSFLLLPAMIKDKTMCMFYADMNKASGLNTSQQQLTLLRTLRNQAVLAIKQKI